MAKQEEGTLYFFANSRLMTLRINVCKNQNIINLPESILPRDVLYCIQSLLYIFSCFNLCIGCYKGVIPNLKKMSLVSQILCIFPIIFENFPNYIKERSSFPMTAFLSVLPPISRAQRQASGAPEFRVKSQEALNATAFLVYPAHTATTKDCVATYFERSGGS